MNISDNAAALAFVCAGATGGMWAAMTTAQLRSARKRFDRLERVMLILLEHVAGPSASEELDDYASDRDPGRLLDHHAARFRSAHGRGAAGG